jgi:hypothetical protein
MSPPTPPPPSLSVPSTRHCQEASSNLFRVVRHCATSSPRFYFLLSFFQSSVVMFCLVRIGSSVNSSIWQFAWTLHTHTYTHFSRCFGWFSALVRVDTT